VLVPFFGEWKGVEGVASLVLFSFFLLLGGLLTIIIGLFTKPAARSAA